MDKLTIDTPEQVHLEFVLAGIGSRFMAAFLDSLIQGALFAILFVIAIILSVVLNFAGFASTWAAAVGLLGGFTIVWGYYTLFEIFWKGQTPGKRWAGIRVIKDSGRPINAFEAIARNVMRVVDWLPSLYAAGVVVMLLNHKHRRLGDFLAGTLVIHESSQREPSLFFNAAPQAEFALPQAARLTVEEADLIETFLARRLEIPAEVRRQNAQRIADRIGSRLEIPVEARPADMESFLELLVKEFRNRAHLR